MPNLKMLALSLLVLGLWAAGASAEQAVEPLALFATEISATAPTSADEANCPVHSKKAQEMADLSWEVLSEPVLMSSDEVDKHPNHEASCYVTGSGCEGCSGGKVKACTYYRCYCSCSGTWYNTKSCTSCNNFC